MSSSAFSEYAGGNWIINGETILPVDKTALHVAVELADVEISRMLLVAGEVEKGKS